VNQNVCCSALSGAEAPNARRPMTAQDECYILGDAAKDRPDLAIEVVWTSGVAAPVEHVSKRRVHRARPGARRI
jgi:hypothetical protein